MILINKVTPFANEVFQKDLIECIINNSNISFISQIVIFHNNTNIVLPKNNKVKLVVKNGYTDKEIIEYCKRLYNEEIFIFSNPFVKFNNSLINLEMSVNKVIKIEDDCYIFSKDINLENYENIDSLFSSFISNNKISIERKHIWTKEIKEDNTFNINKSRQKISVRQQNIRRKELYINSKRNLNELPKIDIIIVSVDYNDFLSLTLESTTKVSNVTVVTSPDDKLCQDLCKKFGANCIITEKMYENGAVFNKGKAINVGINSINNPDWILLLDADIYLPSDFLEILKNTEMPSDSLLVCKRLILDNYDLFLDWKKDKIGGRLERAKGFGYFQMFNIRNFPNNSKIFPETSDDASWSDLIFRDLFKNEVEIDSTVIHLGQTCQNWKGRKTPKFFNISNNKVFTILNNLPFIEKTNYKVNYEKKPSVVSKNKFIIHTTSTHISDIDSNRRVDFAQNTWRKLYESGKIIPANINCGKNDDIPKIKDIIDYGYSLCKSDDDIIMYTNSDICLTDDLYEKVTESCEKWNCTFSFRKDFLFKLEKEMSKEEVESTLWSGGNETPTGADLFAVTKSWWEKWRDYLPNDQVIGRPTWDWIFRITMGKSIEGDIVFSQTFEEQGTICETPNISYHESHNSYWERPENLLDEDSIKNTRIAYYWMKEKSNNINFTGKDYFEKTYGENLFDNQYIS